MNTFAYIVSPLTISQLKSSLKPGLRVLPDFVVRKIYKSLNPFQAGFLERVHCIEGKEAQGYIICCPLLNKFPQDSFVLEKIVEGAILAERLGANIIGIGGYASKIADKKFNSLTKRIKIPVTTGNALIAWSVFEQVYRVSKAKDLDLKNAVVAILGAGSTVGYLCARKISDYATRIIINDSNKDRLEQLKDITLHLHPIEVNICEDRYEAVEEADIVINASDTALNLEALKPKAIYSEVTPVISIIPKHKNITFLESGLVKMPYRDYGNGIINAALAETMLLALDGNLVSYSLGENINPDRLEEIADIAVQHGFEVWAPHAPIL